MPKPKSTKKPKAPKADAVSDAEKARQESDANAAQHGAVVGSHTGAQR